jgi:hypothetical protein
MNLSEVTAEEEAEQIAGFEKLEIPCPTCWGDDSHCTKPGPFVFNFACEGAWCAEHFNQILREFN